MRKWTVLCVVIRKIDVTVAGKYYNYTMTTGAGNDEDVALKGFWDSVGFINNAIRPAAELVVTPVLYLNTIKSLSLYNGGTYQTPYPAFTDLLQSFADNGYAGTISFGKYDSIFVIYPYPAQFNTDGFKEAGLGDYLLTAETNSTYATLPAIQVPGGWNLAAAKGDAFTHEFLHGSCRWFKEYDDIPVPPGESHQDPAYNYTEDTTGGTGWNKFYGDLLRGQLVQQKPSAPVLPKQGIPQSAWAMGCPGDPGDLVGHGSKDAVLFRNAYPGAKSGSPKPWISQRKVHRWSNGEIQDMKGPDGPWALLHGDGRPCCALIPEVWEKFLSCGGAETVGYPLGPIHPWGKGQIQDFENKDSWHYAIMRKTGSSDYLLVKGNIWKAYAETKDANGNGAQSFMGYPTEEEHLWQGSDKKYYHIQYFENNHFCWAQSFSPFKYGNDKNWSREAENEQLTYKLR